MKFELKKNLILGLYNERSEKVISVYATTENRSQ